ncbi:MAG: hypothetical protein BRC58_11220 [Cyanobacteria bacterium QS_8_64_29]|nr:MAG: hypothetical protein BRC58_11220 [Cyanobacteria bacterium QS_8_64_29]
MRPTETPSTSDQRRQGLNALAVLAAFGVNVLANVRPIGGLTLGQISNQLFGNVLITPADYAFAIWGVIYVGLFGFAIYQALPSQAAQRPLRRLGYGVVAASLAQIGWVFLFQLRFFGGSFLAMLAILLPLARIYRRLHRERLTQPQRWFVRIPLSVYLAWISVATLVNAAVALVALGWEGGGIAPEVWTAIAMAVAAALALIAAWRNRDVAFVGVVMWALAAITIRHADKPLIAVVGAGLTLALAVATGLQLRSQKPTDSSAVGR